MKKMCPKCSALSSAVLKTTVKSLLKDELKEKLKNEYYFLCEKSECEISYFNEDEEYHVDDLNISLSFKKKSKEKYICYCNKITEEEIREFVRKNGKETSEVVVKKLREKPISMCKYKNPKGRCCYRDIKKFIDKIEF